MAAQKRIEELEQEVVELEGIIEELETEAEDWEAALEYAEGSAACYYKILNTVSHRLDMVYCDPKYIPLNAVIFCKRTREFFNALRSAS